MQNKRECIFSLYCTHESCDMSCSRNAVSNILIEKSQLDDNVYDSSYQEYSRCWEYIQSHNGLCLIRSNDPIRKANILTYVSICKLCQGYGSAVNVFHLKFSQYMNALRESWSTGVTPKLRETQAFISNSRILIISGLDYYFLKDFECQTLISIFQDRMSSSKLTIVVVRDVNALSGSGSFIIPLKDRLKEVCKDD